MSIEIGIWNISSEKKLGDYYLDFTQWADSIESNKFGPFIFDKQGIPLVDYDRLFKKAKRNSHNKFYGIHYTPVTIAQYALGKLCWYYEKAEKKGFRIFLKMADWFLANVKTKNDFVVWEHTWYEPNYNLEPPWVSAMAQGEGISVLLRAYQLTKNKNYFKVAEKALNSFEYTIEEGGVRFVDNKGNIWYEEYPSNPPSHVLNGFIFGLLGIYDYYRVVRDTKSLKLWKEGIKTLERNLNLYDCGFGSYYDLFYKEVVDNLYHSLHIVQLRVLHSLAFKESFKKYYKQWRAYQKVKYQLIRKIHFGIRRIRKILSGKLALLQFR